MMESQFEASVAFGNYVTYVKLAVGGRRTESLCRSNSRGPCRGPNSGAVSLLLLPDLSYDNAAF
jgi:hypothetical protein